MSTKPLNPKDAVGIRKAALSVLPMNVVAEVGLGMMEGAAKYGRHNFRAVDSRATVYFDATMRHLIAWWEGEDVDPDSGLSHITKAMCSLAVCRDAMMRGNLIDDRPPRSAPFYPEFNKKAGEILDRHADKNPKHYTVADDAQARDDVPTVGGEAPPEGAASREDGEPIQGRNSRLLVLRGLGGLVDRVQMGTEGSTIPVDSPRAYGPAITLAPGQAGGGEERSSGAGYAGWGRYLHGRVVEGDAGDR